jgi:MHS family proline/betaine transporter-like MFS transporter
MIIKNMRIYSFIFASSLGTFLEFFDLALYSFCSPIIAQNFFPANSDSLLVTMATWGIFAVSYLMRPLGAALFGHIADVRSSKIAMVVSMAMMAVATTAMGLLPTYDQIGFFAPVLLLLLRIMQSIAVSPEYNLSSVFIKNNAWCEKRYGFVSSISASVTGLGMLSAGWLMSRVLEDSSILSIAAYKWRSIFIGAGILVGTVGIYLRWTLNTNLSVSNPKSIPIKMVIRHQGKDFMQAIFIAGYIGCITYALFSFLLYQLQTVRLITPGASLEILSHGALIPAIFSLLAGYYSDRIPRHVLMLSSAIIILASGYSLFTYIDISSFRTIIVQTCVMLAGLGFFAGSFPGYLAELFAKEYRYTGSFLAYNIGMSWIGGVSPLLFISLENINRLLPVMLIVIYSLLVILLVARPLVTFGVRRASVL